MAVRRLQPAAVVVALAAACYLVAGRGLVNYDTLYGLVWGRDLIEGRGPEAELPLAPTPKPLGTLLGILLAPFGADAAQGLTIVLAFLGFGVLGLVTYRLGKAWFGPAAGVLAVAILLTRRPVLDFGARAYIDVPYLAFVLGAVLLEVRRRDPRAVLALLTLAGLLRPEAWLFAGGYALLYKRDPKLVALAAIAPVVWCLHDLLLTGDPLHSLTGTRESADTLNRITGLDDVPGTVPRRIGEIVREPVLLGAAVGFAYAWTRKREVAVQAAAVTAVALLAFCVFAAAGLPILGRYLLLPAAVLVLLAAGGVASGLADPDRRWRFAAAVVVGALVVLVPPQVDRLTSLRDALARQDQIQGDLVDRAERGLPGCGVVALPNHRAIPLLALVTGREPDAFAAVENAPDAPTYVAPADQQTAKDYILDRRDLRQVLPDPPRGLPPLSGAGTWRVTSRCP